MIQNMSFFNCPKCNERTYIFGQDGVKDAARKMNIDLLGDIPLHPQVCATSDAGAPIVISQKDSLHAQVYRDIASKISEKLTF
jgi:ATP-binding protein involved in chromosome partitioning